MTFVPVTVGLTDLASLINQESLPVPLWGDLPGYGQKDLDGSGYDQAWFDAGSAPTRLTVLTCYVKLSGMGLWGYVAGRHNTSTGTLEFQASNIAALKAKLASSAEFNRPADSGAWDSREARATYSLHFKHFATWADDIVQAHIDAIGLSCGTSGVGGLCAIPLAVPHLLNYDSYQDVFDIRRGLLRQGWDPACLVGKSGLPSNEA